MSGTLITSENDFGANGLDSKFLGVHHFLHRLGMLPNHVPEQALNTRELRVRGQVHAYTAGLFEPPKSFGGHVASSGLVGLLHHPDTPEADPVRITSPFHGMTLCQRAMAQVVRGDADYQIASDVKCRTDQE